MKGIAARTRTFLHSGGGLSREKPALVLVRREVAQRRVRELGVVVGFPAGKGGYEIRKSCKFLGIDQIFFERANHALSA